MDRNYDGGDRAAATSSELVLQWGNRKRLRCMKKVHNKPGRNINSTKKESPGSDNPVQRVSSRVARSDQMNNNNNNINRSICGEGMNRNGYINLRQRPSLSPPHRILRNSDSSAAMRAQSNGVRGLASPERGGGAHDRRANHHHLSNGNHQANNNSSRCNKNNNNDTNHSSRGGRSPSSETGNDGKNGGSTSASGIVASWPPKFEIALTNKEKEEDFLVLKGSKLPQRPKKRAKVIQRTVNLISPGAWLCDLSLERYEVREKKVTKKRPRGLKAMGNNVESDSE